MDWTGVIHNIVQRVPTSGAMSSLPLDNLDFMGARPSLPGASARPGPAGGQLLSMPGGFHQRAQPMQDVKMAGIRPSLPSTRPSSANSVAGQVSRILILPCNIPHCNVVVEQYLVFLTTANYIHPFSLFIFSSIVDMT